MKAPLRIPFHGIAHINLSRLEDWSRKWQLRFNADKCKVLHTGRDNEHYEYYMDRDTKIGVTTNERDLGVQVRVRVS